MRARVPGLLLAALCGCAVAGAPPVERDGLQGGASIGFGVRDLPEATWPGDLEAQGLFSVSGWFELGAVTLAVPLAVELAVEHSSMSDDDGEYEYHHRPERDADIWELDLGARFTLPLADSRLALYAAWGGAALWAQLDDDRSAVNDHDTGLGTYVRLGVIMRLNANGKALGLEWKRLEEDDMSFGSSRGGADYKQLMLTLSIL